MDGQQVLERTSQNKGGVWLSGYQFAHDHKLLKQHNIQAILSAADLSHKYPEEFTRLVYPLQDRQSQQVRSIFEDVFLFIQQHRTKTNVLVHCAAGVSRSATLLISYIMRKMDIGYEQALKLVKSKRKCAQPNQGFEEQLRAYQRELLLRRRKNSEKLHT